MQLTDVDELRRVEAASEPPCAMRLRHASTDRVIERTAGVFANLSDLGQIPMTWSAQCCTGNAAVALGRVWENIIQPKGSEHVAVNLLLNRVSPWLDVASHLPHEGRVVITNHTARTISLRLPDWLKASPAACKVNGHVSQPVRAGACIVLTDLAGGDRIELTFPVPDETVRFTVLTRQAWMNDPDEQANPPDQTVTYTCRMRGHTLVDLFPRPGTRWYRLYRREGMVTPKALTRTVRRFVCCGSL